MIKFTGTCEEGEVLGIGLSEGNWKKLLEGKPIVFNPADLGMTWKGKVIIMGGPMELLIAAELRNLGAIPPNTPTHEFDETKEQPS